MVTKFYGYQPNQFSRPPSNSGRKSLSKPVFKGSVYSTLGHAVSNPALVSDIKHIGIAERLYKKSGRIQINTNIWGFSFQDFASRCNLLIAVYLPALFFSLYPHKKHFWETNGRNALMWITNIGIIFLTKHPKYGVNAIFNRFMQPKGTKLIHPDGAKLIQAKNKVGHFFANFINPVADQVAKYSAKLLNHKFFIKTADLFRPNYSFYELLKTSGLKVTTEDIAKKEPLWGKLDHNQVEQLKMMREKAKTALETGGKLPGKITRQEAEALVKNVRNFTTRLGGMNLATTAVNILATVYVIGILAMDIVFRFIAPWDKDFDRKKAEAARHKNKVEIPSPEMLSSSGTLENASIFSPAQGVSAPLVFNPSPNPPPPYLPNPNRGGPYDGY
jgi:hypothetical protein